MRGGPEHQRGLGPAFAPGLEQALRALHHAARRPPTAADAPRLSTLPMSRAAREALRYDRILGIRR